MSAVIIGAAIGGLTSFAFAVISEAVECLGEENREDWFRATDWLQIGISTAIGAAEGALLVAAPSYSILICALSSGIDTAIYEAIDGSNIGTIVTKSLFSAFLGAAAGADSSDFIKTRNSLIDMLDAAKKSKSMNIRPKFRKEVKKRFKKVGNKLWKSKLKGLVDDFIYEFLEFISHGWMEL